MSKREELEARIREQRVLEATKKGLVGFSGKIGTVLKSLGEEIIAQDFSMDFPEDMNPTNASELMSGIPTIEIDESVRPEGQEWGETGESYHSSARSIGLHFDGLSRGMHMEIKYDEERSELSLTYKGYTAYRECMGEIETYVPNEEWEGWIERLWSVSKKIQREQKEKDFKNRAIQAERTKQDWLDSLMKRWGRI